MKSVLQRTRMALLLSVAALGFVGMPSPAHAAPVLTATPLSWNVIGLDSNSPTTGPDLFPVGARVCNTGDVTASAVSSQMVWDSANANINIDGASTINVGDIAPSACADAYFHVRVTKVAAAYDTTRQYHITASTAGAATVSTPTPRELYVEHLISQNRNSVTSVTGSAIDQPGTSTTRAHATVFVGHQYSFTVNAKTATGGYEQLETFETFQNPLFRVIGVQATYAQPVGGTNTSVYADACGWDNVPSSPTYRSCVGPTNYAGGKAGGNPISVTYTVVATGEGQGDLEALIYDFSGSSFHYNSDYGSVTSSVDVDVVKAPDVSVSTTNTPLKEGSTGSYNVDVTNDGGYQTSGPITVTDTLPAGLTYTGSSGTGWVCTASGQTVTCTYSGTLAPGQTAPLTINVSVDQNPPSSVTNTATVTGGNDDNSANNTSTDTATVDLVPHPTNDTATTAQDTPVTINVTSNDSGGDGTLTVTGHSNPSHGAVTCTTTDCTYTPSAGYSGPDSFTYTVTDTNGDPATATVSVTVTPAATTTTTAAPVTTTTVAPTTTTVAPTTTTTAAPVTTTTVAPTTTTVAPTTTTTAAPAIATTTTTVAPTTTTVAPTTTTTVAPTTTTSTTNPPPPTTTTTKPPVVSPTSIPPTTVPPTTTTAPPSDPPPTLGVSSKDKPSAADPQVTVSSLAVTGAEILGMVALGLLLIVGGSTLRTSVSRRR